MPDLFALAEIDRRKALLDQLFQESILGLAERDPGHHFWFHSLRVTHGHDPDFHHDVFVAVAQYAEEAHDWLTLNYPTKHWISTGIYTRADHILSVH